MFVLPATDPVREPFSEPIWLCLAPVILACLVALHLKPFWRLSAFAVYLCWLLPALRYTAGDQSNNYFSGLAIGVTCMLALVELVLDDPVSNWQHVSEPGSLVEKPFWKRMWWLATLTFNHRCIGWTIQVPFVPAVDHIRTTYLWRKARQIVTGLIILDMLHVYKALDPVMALPIEQVLPIDSQPYIRRAVAALMAGASVYHRLSIPYDVLAFGVVALGFQEARLWPDTFGDWRDAYTIRQFWARVWHQQLRRFTGPPGRIVARKLGLRPGSWMSARVQLIVGFATSGLVHLCGDYMVHPHWFGASMPFFLWQAVGITIEDFVIDVASVRGIKPSRWTYLLGYLWTWPIWFTFTVPIFTEWMLPAGMAQNNLFSWSIVGPAVDYFQASTGVNVTDYIMPELRYMQ